MKMLYVCRISSLFLVLLFCSINAAAVEAGTTAQIHNSVKSYREWKTSMVDAAESRVQKMKNNLEQQRQISGSSVDPNLKNQLAKEQLQATLAKELTINDYFVGYLNKQANLQEAIKGVAGKLNDFEVAELMSAYAYSFNKSETKPLKSAAESALKFDTE